MQFIVMAAGQGKRMYSRLPKVLHPLAGRPLVAHVLDAARSLSPVALCLVVGHGGDAVRKALAADDLAFVTQDPPRGTGDAVRVALTALGDDAVTVVANGDCPLIPAATFAAIGARAAAGHLALLTAKVSDPTGLGRILRDPAGNVRAIVEERDANRAERAVGEIYTGVLAAPTALLRRWVAALKDDNAQREFYLTDIVAMAVADGVTVEGHVAADERDILGVNDRAQLAAIERIVQARQADLLLASGTWIADPARIDVRGPLTCGRDVRIDVGCVFEGTVTLGDDVSVGAHCVLKNVGVGAGTQIAPFSHLEDAAIGANCRIGPYARLRPGASLADDVHIGNFVEVKQSSVGAGSKANHLAYIGDATIGRNVNVGAGTITCNYDGANKFRTVIEDDAFIGSDTQLVAPVTVGRGATLGAGTTLTRDAPPDTLTVSRVKQLSIPGWQRPRKQPKPQG
ncbi:MAG: bifunctional UDP-N-acetylglucosamine diphosphorylase/glucosamine-1-phosphate N-acetyltransferase GlmU [Betaproteobacteria bacterium]|nr:bifunctional UDP-N-acetylglucosamine diphosphorylase/glucosamine-1-phosphate N-acetyltransferase GlmU [Betaproteobacteria bacterium]MBK8688852.1 bifunctional UDP-N-acetylglucosamine diphosphorylase/glucosamine-1-phosphate N-acetyltransferase GlmU [Betaproteobacteria bacterium]MBK9674561.1 bifunctional UDP-N-acetylglucosamine diphosphorylase/glucosamine-1-phosphate N-acetyltransferase GlmU [Betaproteobacteria bacterium]